MQRPTPPPLPVCAERATSGECGSESAPPLRAHFRAHGKREIVGGVPSGAGDKIGPGSILTSPKRVWGQFWGPQKASGVNFGVPNSPQFWGVAFIPFPAPKTIPKPRKIRNFREIRNFRNLPSPETCGRNGAVGENLGFFWEKISGFWGKNLGEVLGEKLGFFGEMLGFLEENFGIFWGYFKDILGILKEYSGVTQRILRGYLGDALGIF